MSKKPKGKKRTPRKVGVPPEMSEEAEIFLKGLHNALLYDAYDMMVGAETEEDMKKSIQYVKWAGEISKYIEGAEEVDEAYNLD